MANGLQATIKSKKSRFGVYYRGVRRGSVAIGSQGMQAKLQEQLTTADAEVILETLPKRIREALIDEGY